MDWELFYSSFRKPDFIPGYEIQNRLGGGAFGDVYKARKVSIDKAYAIKFLKIDEATSRAAIERELEQVRHFSAIDHPNLVTIEDMGVALNVPFLVMGYAGEDTLARRLKRERLSQAHALSFFVQTCRGVAALHERRLAHFDLKPSNVFLKGDAARVGDYGLAKLLIDGRQTLSFGRGTPHYMAPEMLKNRADQRADIYSLGVILYELYSGHLPFETSADAGVVLREDDTPPNFPDDFPPRLRAVVECCLRIDPGNRFPGVPHLLIALGQTARPGDPLVAIESLPPDIPALIVPSASAISPQPAPSTARKPQLRSTATDLTRGAVEVARGVWEGLKNPRGETSAPLTPPPVPRAETPTPRASATPPPIPRVPAVPVAPMEPLDDVLSIQTLEEAAEQSRLVRSRQPAVAPASPAKESQRSPPSVNWSGTATAAVPVPPRSTRGVFGALRATAELGLEVLMALISGPVKKSIGGVGRAGGELVSGGRGWFLAALRLCLFLAGMLVLGAALMYLLFLFLKQP
ncbi:MAG TPA: protein kinase [Planctomycetota bacterium]|nr:protein kinase [Planctomycetota bacterium]